MKKILFLIQLTAAVILFSPLSYADYDNYGQRGRGWGGQEYEHHHHRHHHYQQPEVRYYPQPPVVYYPQPPVRYYPQPPVQYYPQPQPYPNNSLRLSW